MRTQVSIVAAVLFAGCASQPPVPPPPDGHVRVKEMDGCCRKIKPRQSDVRLGSELEQSLRAQLASRKLDMPQCWYEEKADHIVLEAGDTCEGYDEVHFAKINGNWQLTDAVRNDFVSCVVHRK